ncbi:hypothetical protein OAF42_00665 [Planctomicrobium sp.]|jgi:hypothetical protein|nr:hypothetical protein [Planctomicrobium sp.]MDA7527593.1 hypothetical protein [bacterium]MDB4732930.1 hypothetical protein [Planctomicrobium sp.]
MFHQVSAIYLAKLIDRPAALRIGRKLPIEQISLSGLETRMDRRVDRIVKDYLSDVMRTE